MALVLADMRKNQACLACAARKESYHVLAVPRLVGVRRQLPELLETYAAGS